MTEMFNAEGVNWEESVKKLALNIDKLTPVGRKIDTNFTTAPEKLLDCVLSLHRRYDEFVVPRIIEFKNRHPDVITLTELCQCVANSGGPAKFYENELDYDYDDAAEMFGKVLNYLTSESESSKYLGQTDMEKCRQWAISATIYGYKRIWEKGNIPLFGIAGWQYLRMLFGADTCKPDIAVKGYVEDCLERALSGHSTVVLMEAAAPLASTLKFFSQPVREADRRIWHQYNNRKKQAKVTVCH
jgi:hypothetical protein